MAASAGNRSTCTCTSQCQCSNANKAAQRGAGQASGFGWVVPVLVGAVVWMPLDNGGWIVDRGRGGPWLVVVGGGGRGGAVIPHPHH